MQNGLPPSAFCTLHSAFMLTPPRALPPGGRIAVVAPAGPSDRARIEEAARKIEQRGYRVTIAANVDHRHNEYLAGDDDERVAELNHYLRSGDNDAIFCARGGYGAMRILDRIDFDALRANPRPVVGFSDITAIHQAIAVRCGIGSFHGPMLNLDFFAPHRIPVVRDLPLGHHGDNLVMPIGATIRLSTPTSTLTMPHAAVQRGSLS